MLCQKSGLLLRERRRDCNCIRVYAVEQELETIALAKALPEAAARGEAKIGASEDGRIHVDRVAANAARGETKIGTGEAHRIHVNGVATNVARGKAKIGAGEAGRIYINNIGIDVRLNGCVLGTELHAITTARGSAVRNRLRVWNVSR